VTTRALPPLQRDIFFLALGGVWGSYIVYTAGPWPLMLISSATMLGPGFLRLWLSRPGIAASLSSGPSGPGELSPSSSPTSPALDPGADAA
jgi:hypothetical protein